MVTLAQFLAQYSDLSPEMEARMIETYHSLAAWNGAPSQHAPEFDDED